MNLKYPSFMLFTDTFNVLQTKENSPRYIILTVKNAAKVMVGGVICANGRCGLWFMPDGTSINGTAHLNVLKESNQT